MNQLKSNYIPPTEPRVIRMLSVLHPGPNSCQESVFSSFSGVPGSGPNALKLFLQEFLQ